MFTSYDMQAADAGTPKIAGAVLDQPSSGLAKRVTLVISSLRRGGAERVASLIANAWADQQKKVTLLTYDHGEAPGYWIDPRVDHHSLGLEAESTHFVQAVFRNVKRILVLRRAIKRSRPDVVISLGTQTNVITILATRRMSPVVIVRETLDPVYYSVERIWGSLRRLLYPRADILVCATAGTLARYQAMIRVRGATVPNPVLRPAASMRCLQAQKLVAGHMLVAMGRLVRSKGFDLLLEAFSEVADRHPDWSLRIIGKGPLRSELESQRDALGLARRVDFVGELADPFPVLCAADLFVFSSRSESFGMALAEAMACGLPVISFDCPEGPSRIIRDGIDGVLVPPEDVTALASALDRLMGSPQERARLARRAPEVTIRFSLDRISSLWQQLFDELLAQKRISV